MQVEEREEYVDSLEETYEDYLRKQSAKPNSISNALLRSELMCRIFREKQNLMSNEMFLTLLEHEEGITLNSRTLNMPTRNILAVTRALQYHRGLNNFNPEWVMQLLKVNSRMATFELTVSDWLVRHYMGLDLNPVKGTMLSYLYRNITLRGIEFLDSIYESMLSHYRGKVDTALTARLSGDTDSDNKRELIRSCVILFLLHTTIDDTLNAEYYLLKAVELNHKDSECKMLLKFLENIILVG